MSRPRLDERMVAEGMACDLRQARGLVMQGRVLVDDRPQTKPGTRLPEGAALRLKGQARARFVSRGGDKLQGALEDLGLSVAGCRCADIGASTGGFSDCLLQGGAEAVCCVDVGYGLLADRVRRDERVVVRERTNARLLTAEQLPWPPDLVTVDASFIRVRTLLPALTAVAAQDAWLLAMVKPQFELPARDVAAGGVVRDDHLRQQAVALVTQAAVDLGWRALGEVASRVAGPKGNREVFVWLGRGERGHV
jgi:23S rRNA (cytidine1920-2'-O)/16S rRNA (cytidine1409-2'-O)-methyltransferase